MAIMIVRFASSEPGALLTAQEVVAQSGTVMAISDAGENSLGHRFRIWARMPGEREAAAVDAAMAAVDAAMSITGETA